MYGDVDLQLEWDETNKNFSLLEYIPVNRGGSLPVRSRLILDFKDGYPQALKEVEELAIEAWSMAEEDFRMYTCRYLVSVPSSDAQRFNTPCEAVCAALAAHFPYLTHLEGALRRIETVPKSATAPAGMRPSYSDHFRTIRYVGPRLSIPNRSIIMVDDILTRGKTSGACRDILRQATHCKSVLGFFIGRTVY